MSIQRQKKAIKKKIRVSEGEEEELIWSTVFAIDGGIGGEGFFLCEMTKGM